MGRESIAAAIGGTLLLLAFVAHCDSLGTVMNVGSAHGVTVNLLELGHACIGSPYNVEANADWQWDSRTGADCVVNVDSIAYSLNANPNITCLVQYDNVYQQDPNTGKDIWVAASTIVAATNNGTGLCVTGDVTSIGGKLAVTRKTNCTACATGGSVGTFSTDTIVNMGDIDISVTAYSSVFSGNCASYTVSPGINNFLNIHGGTNSDCSAPLALLQLTAPVAEGCNVTISPSIPHALSIFVGHERNAICVSKAALASAGTVTVTYSGPCPACSNF